jgi:hypothetical protein
LARSADLRLDIHTTSLLDAIVGDASLMAAVPDRLCTQLPLLLPMEAGRVAKFVGALLDAIESGRRSDPGWGVSVGPDLIAISVTLQRMRPFREQGMSLFERLLAGGAYGIDAVLFDVDARPRRGGAPPPAIRRRFARRR